jgi:hypothetical protein
VIVKIRFSQRQEALPLQLSHTWSAATPVFDDDHLVFYAGLVPVLALAERTGLSRLITDRVRIDPGKTKVASAGVNPAPKLTSIIAGWRPARGP